MANLCREAALGPIRSIRDIRNINANEVCTYKTISLLNKKVSSFTRNNSIFALIQ